MKKVFVFIMTLLLFALPALAEEGLTFELESKYVVDGELALPSTVEATLLFPKSFQGRGGVVIGNYKNTTDNGFNFEIHNNGNPRVYIVADGESYDVIFDKADVRTGEKVDVAVTINYDTRELFLYVDGEKIQRKKMKTLPESIPLKNSFILGGDNRSGNAQYFKGEIFDLSLYSAVKTPDEIAGEGASSDSLIAGWDSLSGEHIKDLGTGGHDIKLSINENWTTEGGYKGEYAYSFALVGDTQSLNYNYPQKFHLLYDWIVDNAESKKMKFVFGLGDITDNNLLWEWALAKQLINKLNGVLPYSIVRGNHDGIQNFNEIFPLSEYSHMIAGSYDDSMLNTYQTFEVGNIKYLVLNLDLAMNDETLLWADEVVSSHPDRNVIVTTHIYLHSDGTTVDRTDPTPATNYGSDYTSDVICEKFIKKHENIKMVFSGHRPCDNIVVTYETGDKGNKIAQVLVDPQSIDVTQGPSGLVAMLYFSDDGKTVNTDFYSTVKNKYYYNDENTLTFEVEVIGENPSATDIEKLPEAPEEEQDVSMWLLVVVSVAVVVIVGFILGFIIGKKKKA